MSTKPITPILLLLVSAFLAYTTWIYFKPHPDRGVPTNVVLAGKQVWQDNNCTACHQIFGLGGYLGPDLTNIYSAPGKGPLYIRAFVTGGTATMPGFKLSDADMQALIDYLKHVDASGQSDPNSYTTQADGTIERK